MARDNTWEWVEEAKNDFEMAGILLAAEKFNGAVFHLQQAVEKMLKAILYFLDTQPWGQSIPKLMERIEEQDITFPNDLKSIARDLDRHYTASRYPDVLPEITPQKTYDRVIAERVRSQAQTILDFCSNIIDNRSKGGENDEQ